MTKVLPLMEYDGPISCTGGACLDVKGKVAVIIGASTGLGRGVADRLAAGGMRVVGTSRTPELYTGDCTYTKPGDKCKAIGWSLWQLDVTSQDSVDKFIQRVKGTYGQIDLLHLNAGRGFGSNILKPAGKTWCNDIDQQKLVMETNYWGPLRVLMAAQPLIPNTGYARILITLSLASWVGTMGGLPYSASKAAALHIGEQWRIDFFGRAAGNVRFTAIHPGGMLSDIARKSVPGCQNQAAKFENEWRQWEAGQFSPTSSYITPVQGGEAVYRLAISPAPLRRYMLNEKRSANWMWKRLCTVFTSPMDIWPKSFD